MINILKKHKVTFIAVLVVGVFVYLTAFTSTIVPGHQKQINSDKIGKNLDSDGNGFPDAGVTVNGKYTSLYAYDDNGNWYWDLGDGRVRGNVDSVNDLDKKTLTECDYQVEYRGSFENDPFLNSGWVKNNINCSGFDDNNKYNYTIVHQTDPRYEGNPNWSIWGDWEYHTLTESGTGNLVRPEKYIN